MVGSPHQRAEYQAQYFVLPSFDHLRELVPELRAVLAEQDHSS
jgi:phenylalanine-4-hydroxylase